MGIKDLAGSSSEDGQNLKCDSCGEKFNEKEEHFNTVDGEKGERLTCPVNGRLSSCIDLDSEGINNPGELYEEFMDGVEELKVSFYLYILELEIDGDIWYYIGSTEYPENRMGDHFNKGGDFRMREEIEEGVYTHSNKDIEIKRVFRTEKVEVSKRYKDSIKKVREATEKERSLELCIEMDTTNILGGS